MVSRHSLTSFIKDLNSIHCLVLLCNFAWFLHLFFPKLCLQVKWRISTGWFIHLVLELLFQEARQKKNKVLQELVNSKKTLHYASQKFMLNMSQVNIEPLNLSILLSVMVIPPILSNCIWQSSVWIFILYDIPWGLRLLVLS